MKISSILLLLGTAVAAAASAASVKQRRLTEEEDLALQQEYKAVNDALTTGKCAKADPNNDAQWQPCKLQAFNKLKKTLGLPVQRRLWPGSDSNRDEDGQRELWGGPALNDDDDGEAHTGNATFFAEPCVALPDDPVGEGWTQLTRADDAVQPYDLSFTFSFYGTQYNSLFITANGNLAFTEEGVGNALSSFTPLDFLNPGFDMVAPFWADVDHRFAGDIWYKEFPGGYLSVIWDRVPFAWGGNLSNKRNTFQVVISDGRDGGRLGQSNVCFCYVDMDWWTGLFASYFPNPAANVGLNSKNTGDFLQVGRFGMKGSAYDGGYGDVDGIDFLDFKGSTIVPGNYTDVLEGYCFDAMSTANIPPVASNFPQNGTYNIPCLASLDISLSFSTPENDQVITVVDPPTLGALQARGLVYTKTSNTAGDTVTVTLQWSPDFAADVGTYTLAFQASDDFAVPATITRTLTINVAQCGDGSDMPTGCTEISGTTCTAGNPQPFCTPWRSPESCPMDESYPLYLQERKQIMQNAPSMIEGLGYWFHFLADKVAAYAFTASAGYQAPELLCCAGPSDWESACFPSGHGLTAFVIRAVGSHHSNAAVYALPSGFGGPELTRPLAAMTQAQVAANIASLSAPPTKILVERYVGDAGALPDEYKVHAFNGTVGAISMILNRGTDCACYAEVDRDWNRLDKFGCFTPSFSMGQDADNDRCYDIDTDTGAGRPFPMKGHDLCGKVPLLSPTCILQDLISISEALSTAIGVAVRIDFFVVGTAVYVQEYTFAHNGGLRHCSARETDNGCVDSCFLGRMWKENGSTDDERTLGGPVTPRPTIFDGWSSATPTAQCATASGQALSAPIPTCGSY